MSMDQALSVARSTPGRAVIGHRRSGEILVVRTSDLGYWLYGRGGYRCCYFNP